ncbi:DUF2156 domain-containing protein [Anaerocolumna chitinilytica]|uniref:Phosphatidylglycerol lysyltransferase C-terminal domain-containing protein n=1 Tax=Anaerocolumna chitinilytica TaxID=1727145 RepID=A0A7I8DHS0_9FIRM|nr:phosphatidylglycerol lysyltransferase domain-containing protein [Anaerocolumna chitinilytica]BCJ97872.1 hypothetical protein bsdcttw_09130 [Anaerocolumna chitinilytica]
MGIELKKLTLADCMKLDRYSTLRPVYLSERQPVNQFIWEEFYNTHYYQNDTYMMCVIQTNDISGPMMPLCKTEDIPAVFQEIKAYWNQVLGKPLNMYLLDETFINALRTIPGFEEEFKIEDCRDNYDYLYDAEKLRTLSGKAYHKKKNHLNSFLKGYEGRYEFKILDCSNVEEIESFHDRWLDNRDYEDKHGSMRSEENGIHRLFKYCGLVDCQIGGVYIDGNLEAYSIGSYAPEIKCAFIHIEKANINIPGLYNFINQQFLIHCFPEAELVNREDDLGQEGLRKAKLSYQPIRLESKYHIFQNS